MKTTPILGVNFFGGTAAEAVTTSLRGGLVVVPSAPVLVGMEKDPALRTAVLEADLAITDSGLMVLMWWWLTREKLERVSGLEYLKLLLTRVELRQPGAVFWVMPTAAARDQNLAWFKAQGYPTTADDCYLAPQYAATGPLADALLLEKVRQRRPAHIIVALGGGVQERLAYALRESLARESGPTAADPVLALNTESAGSFSDKYRPGIHCIGAAIGFLSGEQVKIPMWVDYLYLGWLWRSVSAPGKFIPRYWKAKRLMVLMIRYRAKAPVSGGP